MEPDFAGRLRDVKVTIVGLGLMGGSLAGALRGQCRMVTGVARRAESVDAALNAGLIDRGTTELAGGVAAADVVILATPVRIILRQLAEIGPLLPAGCLVMDLGSTKSAIVAAMDALPAGVQPVGGHPMCGRETSGLDAADPGLYQGCTLTLSPLPRTSPAALALAGEVARAAGAQPLVLEAERQDRLVATLSHLPYLLACGLVATADAMTSPDPAAWEIVAGGFRDTSRVAGSDVTMMLDILMTNREAVLQSAAAFQGQLGTLARLLEAGDEEALRTNLAAIRSERMRMFP